MDTLLTMQLINQAFQLQISGIYFRYNDENLGEPLPITRLDTDIADYSCYSSINNSIE